MRAWMLLLAMSLSIASVASAQDNGDEDSGARRAFRLGQAHYENGQFAEAAAEFEEAYRLSHRVRLLYNAYLAYRDMQDLPNSARCLRQFLADSTDLGDAERDQLTARLSAIEAALSRNESTVTEPTHNPNTTISPTTETGTPTATRTTGGGGGFNPSPVGFIVGGVGAALLIGSIITGAMASSDFGTLNAMCGASHACPDTQELRSAQSRGSTLALVTDIFWPTGLVALGVGVALIFILQEGGSSAPSAGAMCTQEGCMGAVRGVF